MSLITVPTLHPPPTRARTRARTHTHRSSRLGADRYPRARKCARAHTHSSPHLGADRNAGRRIRDERSTRRRRGEKVGRAQAERDSNHCRARRGKMVNVVSLSTYAGQSCACARARARVCVCGLCLATRPIHHVRTYYRTSNSTHTH